MKKNKKAQIGATFTWFFATLIIFFIIVLYLGAAIIFSGQKKVISGSDKIIIEKKTNELANYDFLLSFLEKKIIFENKSTSIKDMIIQGFSNDKQAAVKTRIKEELDKITKNPISENNCYLLNIEYPTNAQTSSSKINICSFTCSNDVMNSYIEQYKIRLLSQAISLNLYTENEIIAIKYFSGAC